MFELFAGTDVWVPVYDVSRFSDRSSRVPTCLEDSMRFLSLSSVGCAPEFLSLSKLMPR